MINTEIERKWLLHSRPNFAGCTVQKITYISQTYLPDYVGFSVRLSRVQEEFQVQYFLSLKSKETELQRTEINTEIEPKAFKGWKKLANDIVHIDKERVHVKNMGRIWEVDTFYGPNSGLVLAECEFNSIEDANSLPEELPSFVADNLVREVTGEEGYYGSVMAGV